MVVDIVVDGGSYHELRNTWLETSRSVERGGWFRNCLANRTHRSRAPSIVQLNVTKLPN